MIACASEGDGALSGLIVDVLGDTLVVASSAAWVCCLRCHAPAPHECQHALTLRVHLQVERYRAEIGACLRELTGADLLMSRLSHEV